MRQERILFLFICLRKDFKNERTVPFVDHVQTSAVAFFQPINQTVPLQGTSGIVLTQRHPLSA